MIGIQLGIHHGRRLQESEQLAMVQVSDALRWVCTSRDTIEGSPGLVVFTIEDFVWHTVTLYVTAHGDTIVGTVIEPYRQEGRQP